MRLTAVCIFAFVLLCAASPATARRAPLEGENKHSTARFHLYHFQSSRGLAVGGRSLPTTAWALQFSGTPLTHTKTFWVTSLSSHGLQIHLSLRNLHHSVSHAGQCAMFGSSSSSTRCQGLAHVTCDGVSLHWQVPSARSVIVNGG
jgi:hypothetical protein